MTKVKKPAKKKVAPSKVKLISYAIKMVIPTVAYGNIQPEIIVKANSLEEAHDYIVPHMNKLWKEYYLVDGKRPEPTPAPVVTTPENTTTTNPDIIIAQVDDTQPPPSSVALVKATQAIESCMSKEALDMIIDQVHASVKLTDEDKVNLAPLLDAKYTQFNG